MTTLKMYSEDTIEAILIDILMYVDPTWEWDKSLKHYLGNEIRNFIKYVSLVILDEKQIPHIVKVAKIIKFSIILIKVFAPPKISSKELSYLKKLNCWDILNTLKQDTLQYDIIKTIQNTLYI